MNTPVNPNRPCPTCGQPVPAAAPAGLCPRCLLAGGAEPPSASRSQPSGLRPQPSGFRSQPSGFRFHLEEIAALFPNLEILRPLGAGGMGAVYQARQPALDRLVALKILPRGGPDAPQFTERFNREARALARLSHPHIVAVHEFGQTQGLHYFIMEYVDGTNLRQLQQAGRLSPREALQIVPQICDALQYAHDEGVVHRDIKPENILVDRRGRVKIADFGLARILDTDTSAARLTADGQVMGTPHYMAPEQVERPLTVDHRADIYSLGVVFYEMLTGDLPLGKFPPPSRKVEVDVRLDEIVLRTLENDPERRYQRAGEVKTQLSTMAGTPSPGAGSHASAPPAAESPGPSSPTPPRTLHWAGIPVVIERDGEREVSFSGALTALATALGASAVALAAIHLATGVPHTMPRTAALLAVATIVLGIRHTLRRPDPPTVLTAQGTRILPPERPALSARNLAGWAALALAIVGLHFLKRDVINPLLQRNSPNTVREVPAHADPARGTHVAPVPGGGTVELLAIGEGGSSDDRWWSLQGTPLENQHFVLSPAGTVFTEFEARTRQFVLRLMDLPQGASGTRFTFDPPAPHSGGGTVFGPEGPIDGAWPLVAAFPPSLRSTTLRVGLDFGPWNTITTHLPEERSSTQFRHPGHPRWTAAVHRATESNGSAQITVLLATDDQRWKTRVVALDHEGTPHPYTDGDGTPATDGEVWTFAFRDLPLARIREFQVQVRPIHWFRFENIRLDPVRP
ncbi:MAG: serine/threonine protein kinase [Verrucomicrobiae bacterium]|nr:serine/threonine protein kinase [Verrucomicrobiae bacterium]